MMATGDQNDITGRLRSLLPARWFPDTSPILDGVLSGISVVLSHVYQLYAYARLQTRIATSTDAWLDLVSNDYFGATLPRYSNELDSAFLARIRANLFVRRTTRPAMVQVLTTLTGHAPLILEPNNPSDMAATRASFCGSARMGSMGTPFNALIIAYRPTVSNQITPGAAFANAPTLSAMGEPTSQGYTGSLANQQTSITDAAIFAAIEATKPAATVIGVSIQNWVDPTLPTLIDSLGNTVLGNDPASGTALPISIHL